MGPRGPLKPEKLIPESPLKDYSDRSPLGRRKRGRRAGEGEGDHVDVDVDLVHLLKERRRKVL